MNLTRIRTIENKTNYYNKRGFLVLGWPIVYINEKCHVAMTYRYITGTFLRSLDAVYWLFCPAAS